MKLAESTFESSGFLSLLDFASSSSIHPHMIIRALVTIVPDTAIVASSALATRYLIIISLFLDIFLDLLIINIATTVLNNFIDPVLDMGRQIVHIAIGLIHLVNESVVLSLLFLSGSEWWLVLSAIAARTTLPRPVALRRF